MTEQPEWVPDDDELDRFARESSVVAGWFLYDRHGVSAMVREAVEKALAEQEARHTRELEKAVAEARLITALEAIRIPPIHGIGAQLLADMNTRHDREIERARLEAKIDALDDLWVCTLRNYDGTAIECEWYSNVTPDSVRLEVARLAAELAALTTSEPQIEGEVKP